MTQTKLTDQEVISGFCYVVRPANDSQDWDSIFKHLIFPPVHECGFERIELGRPMGKTGSRFKDIIEPMLKAELIIIDVTCEQDPTVHYLLGVCHARANRTILITQKPDNILSDFRGYYSVNYTLGDFKASSEFSSDFLQLWQQIQAEPQRPDNPVREHLQGEMEKKRNQIEREELERKLKEKENAKPQTPSGRTRTVFTRKN